MMNLVLAVLLQAGGSFVTRPVSAVQVDPLAADTFAAAYLWRGTVLATGQTRTDFWGGRGLAQLGIGRWGIAVRGDISGLPGNFDVNDATTFRSAEGYVAIHRNLAGGDARPVVGLTAFGGAGIDVDEGGIPTTGKFTAAVGARVAGVVLGQGAAAYVGVGYHQAVGGLAGIASVHLPLTSRLFVMADAGIGAGGRAYARIATGVVLAQ